MIFVLKKSFGTMGLFKGSRNLCLYDLPGLRKLMKLLNTENGPFFTGQLQFRIELPQTCPWTKFIESQWAKKTPNRYQTYFDHIFIFKIQIVLIFFKPLSDFLLNSLVFERNWRLIMRLLTCFFLSLLWLLSLHLRF